MTNRSTPWLGTIVILGLSSLVHADGEEIYQEHCGSCHDGGFKGMMARAPKTGKDSAWTEFFEVSIDQSKLDVFNGTSRHTAMGKEADLSLEEVGNAVDFILSKTDISI